MTNENNFYKCDEGKVFRRISDGFIMGDGLDLGVYDSIENYEEIDDPNPKEEEKEENVPVKKNRKK